MKANSLLILLALAGPLVAQPPTAPVAKPEAPKQDLSPNQQAFLNLPEAKRNEFAKHLGEATRLFNDKRIFETMEELDKAEAIFKDSPEIYNIRGSCLIEMRSFPKALAQFEKARSYAKENPSIDFNIAEVYFVTKEWKKGSDLFEKILKVMPEGNTALTRLMEFKILLCKKKLGLKDDVAALVDKYDYLDDSPYYYYVQAMLAYDAKDLIKAEEWLARANRIFRDPAILTPWQDTMVEYGYIQSFYGGEGADNVATPSGLGLGTGGSNR